MLPEIAWAGISLAIYTGLLVPMVASTVTDTDDHNAKLMKSMYAMVSLGVGEIVGSLAIGQVIDRFGNKLTSWLTAVMIAMQTILTLCLIKQGTYGPLVFVVTFVWGL
jgi:predicted MFS family arabinose efflux permease